MNILLLTRYGDLGASSRLRSFQYIPKLEKEDISIDPYPLFDNAYLERDYSGEKISKRYLLGRYIKRIWSLVRSYKYDAVWIEKELFPYLPAVGERLLSAIELPYLVDYDDAVFHYYDDNDNTFVRKLLGQKIDAVMREASVVVAGNEYIYERAESSGAETIYKIPTPIDLGRYEPGGSSGTDFTIGWIGTPRTAKYLPLVEPALVEVLDQIDAQIKLIGAGGNPFDEITPVVCEWSSETEVEHIQSFDIGIMPLEDNPFERGKCAYKLLQYMACGKPAVASPVGMNQEVVSGAGFPATNTTEWVEAILRLYKDAELRQELGMRGYEKVKENYSLKKTSNSLTEAIKETVNGSRN